MSAGVLKEWWTPAELAGLKLPGLPSSASAIGAKADAEGWRKPGLEYPANPKGLWRKRSGRGGGFEYRYDCLPLVARTKLMHAEAVRAGAVKAQAGDESAGEMWRWFEGLTETKKKKAEQAVVVLQAVAALELSGLTTSVAVALVAAEQKVSEKTIFNWKRKVAGLSRAHWLPALAPRHVGRIVEAECSLDAWDVLKSDYFRAEAPDFSACYRRTLSIAKERGWTLPPARTMERRVQTIPRILHILSREGVEAAARLYPAQIRDKSVYHACEAVNADGHVWDVFVRYPDGAVERPIMVGFQDVYSGKLLSWRFCRSENKETVLLAFGDLVTDWGIPRDAYLDNGRAFASKWISGGSKTRYRFKIRETDPQGVLTSLGVNIHWATPYHGQAKPIERAWRDFAREYAKHPAFAGAYVGNKPDAKPENYGSKAIPFEEFERVVAAGIAEHNARKGRKSRVCGGKLSFDDVFAASYQQHPILKATPEQSRLWLLAAEGVKVRENAQIGLLGNTYWSDDLIDLIGHDVTIRFDVDDLHASVHVYRLDGAYIGLAECIAATGFNDIEAARTHSRARKDWLKAQRAMLAAETRLGIDDIAALLPETTKVEKPRAKVVQPATFTGPKPDAGAFDQDAFERGLAALQPSAEILRFKQKESDAA